MGKEHWRFDQSRFHSALMFGWSLKLFRVRGIPLAVHGSFFILLAWFGWAGWDEAGMKGLLWSLAILLAFFTCVVLHELGHSFTAQHYGVGVTRILLLPIGGMAQFDRIPRQPRHELLITLAGPAVNFVIAGLLWPFLSFPPGWTAVLDEYSLRSFWYLLFAWNLVMGCFNLLPAFPMDGGRILRALLAIRLNYLRATWWAATVGKVVCAAAITWSFWRAATISLEDPMASASGYYLKAVLFAFIFVVGEMELRAVRRREMEDEEWRRRIASVYVPPASEPPILLR